VVASIDGYGNLKTTIRASEITYTPGQRLLVLLHGNKHEALVTDGTFNIPQGSLAFAPGSSGHDNRFMELFLRGGSATALFDNPQVEEPLHISFP